MRSSARVIDLVTGELVGEGRDIALTLEPVSTTVLRMTLPLETPPPH